MKNQENEDFSYITSLLSFPPAFADRGLEGLLPLPSQQDD